MAKSANKNANKQEKGPKWTETHVLHANFLMKKSKELKK